MIEAGSVCRIITRTLHKKILKNAPAARWITTKQDKDLKTFSNKPIKVLGKTTTTIIYNDWFCEYACLTVVEDGQKLLIERHLFNSLGLAVVQQAKTGKCDKNIDIATCKKQQTMTSKFPHVVSRIGISEKHVVKSEKVSLKVYKKASKRSSRSH